MQHLNGIILKGIGGFYYVEAAGEVYECKARGLFRKNLITPLPGDKVDITVDENRENTIDIIHERNSVLKRPPIANIDRLYILLSVCDPKPNTLVADKITAIACKNNIEPVIVITKSDLGDVSELKAIYGKTGFKMFVSSDKDETGLESLKDSFIGHISAFCGNSGVGKSTLLNRLYPQLNLKTGEISDKLGRGKHTTRHVELFKIENGFIADTPGFSSVDIENSEIIMKDDLQFYFPEFQDYLGTCKFSTCAHIADKGCSIVKAVEENKISKQRHENYISMYNAVKNIKEWEVNE